MSYHISSSGLCYSIVRYRRVRGACQHDHTSEIEGTKEQADVARQSQRTCAARHMPLGRICLKYR